MSPYGWETVLRNCLHLRRTDSESEVDLQYDLDKIYKHDKMVTSELCMLVYTGV